MPLKKQPANKNLTALLRKAKKEIKKLESHLLRLEADLSFCRQQIEKTQNLLKGKIFEHGLEKKLTFDQLYSLKRDLENLDNKKNETAYQLAFQKTFVRTKKRNLLEYINKG
ncbi:MAG TPA: hypothetical protein VGA49_03855 [Patescibacteria group bacterium]